MSSKVLFWSDEKKAKKSLTGPSIFLVLLFIMKDMYSVRFGIMLHYCTYCIYKEIYILPLRIERTCFL
ncbi:hypothetical protein GCM10007140_34700 [Priestia taiwanensis]|uniref:Uncharacterized protein n=1 Tax=Priestia taiwanensis TaxID=1347902 RepID=A0A917ESA2_9BACI|nr:hypothetical protein GCM10007140_34700 [Priestia taiwanensis]